MIESYFFSLFISCFLPSNLEDLSIKGDAKDSGKAVIYPTNDNNPKPNKSVLTKESVVVGQFDGLLALEARPWY